MKQPTGNPSSLFCEQVSTVTLLFEKWNECERTVVMYALLKRLSFPTLKFLQFSIENNLTQNFCSQKNINMIETDANDSKHLQKLVAIYKSLSIVELSQIVDKDSILYESDFCLKNPDKNYSHKEDILYDVLNMIPLLKPGNEEAKKCYLSLIPLAVEDTVRQLVAAELVQQIFSYLLIHPAISNEDRRSLSHWLRHLEEHIQSSFTSGHRGFYIFANSNEAPMDNSSTSSTSLSNSSHINTWQAIAPPSNKQNQQYQSTQQLSNLTSSLNSSSSTSSSEWNLNILSLPTTSGLNNSNSNQNSLGIVPTKNIETDNAAEDSHISFSKNGTEVLDFEDDGIFNPLETYIGSHLHVPTIGNFDNLMLNGKTRRSNSLTTPSSFSYKTTEVNNRLSACSNSTDNLTQFVQKPRSYSLSIESPKNAMQSSVSETQLNDLKPNYLKFTSRNVGMSNIGQWLKSLRLHKYIDLFNNITYEQMLGISENYLQGLGVTKGASHKLALCIEKLKGRYMHLSTIEMNLIENKISISTAIEALADSVLTPMKPIESLDDDNVASKFLEVLDIVYQTILKRGIGSNHDEECVNGIIWVLERGLHNEAFVDHSNKLKEYKFKLSKLKMQFVQKNHSKGNTSSSSISKPRWSSKGRKPDSNAKAEPIDRMQRKNSCEASNFNAVPLHQIRNNVPMLASGSSSQNYTECEKNRASKIKNQYYSATNIASSSTSSTASHQCKSASYPSFSSNISTANKAVNEPKRPDRQRHTRFEPRNNCQTIMRNSHAIQQQHTGFSANPTTSNLTMKNCSNNPSSLSHSYSLSLKESPLNNEFLASTQSGFDFATKKKCITNVKTKSDGPSENTIIPNSTNSICDINSSLEFLCLQMTEQAIN